MKKRNVLNMKSLMEDINKASKLLKSSYLFEDFGMNPEEQGYEDEPMGQEGMPQDDEMTMEEPQFNEQTVDTINQIRELAIQGIAQYANDVESEQYRALKRIWLETDKFYETINGDKDKK